MNCQRCGQPASEDESILVEGRRICAACKPVVVQELKEGCLVPVADPFPQRFDEGMLDFWRLFSLTWRVFRRDALAICGLVILVAVPVNLLLLATEPEEGAYWNQFWRQFRFMQFLEIMVGVLTSLGIARIVEQRLLGRSMSFGAALRHSFSCWFPAVITGWLETFIVLFLSLALIVPGIIWSVYYTFSSSVVSLRTVSGKAALDYSKSLVKGRWWGVLGRILGLSLIALLPAIFLEVVVPFVTEDPVVLFAMGLVSDTCLSFASVGTTVLFLNLDAVRHRETLQDPSPLPQ